MKKLKVMWASLWQDTDRRVRLGRILGLTFATLGFVIMAKAWDGAAGQNSIPAQIPYVISGGFMGLGLVVTGVALLFLSTVRAERQVMTEKFDEMNKLLARNLGRLQFSSNGSTGGTAAASQQVVAGKTVYHLAECKILEGKQGMTTVTVQQAAAEDLSPCRVCDPPAPPSKESAKESSEREKAAATGSSS